MRTIIVLIFVLILSATLFAQSDSVYVNFAGDTVQIWNTLIDENCAFEVIFHIAISNDTITVIEHDTTTNKVTCSCFYDLCVSINDLEIGSYIVNVYRKFSAEYYNPDSLYFIGSTTFTNSHQPSNDPSFNFFQSGCYVEVHVEDKFTVPEKYFLLNAYPNPFNATSNIEIQIPTISNITLNLFDISGKFVDRIFTNKLTPGTHNYRFNGSNLASGTYIITLESDNILRTSTKIVILK
jgi:hypothetical protein